MKSNERSYRCMVKHDSVRLTFAVSAAHIADAHSEAMKIAMTVFSKIEDSRHLEMSVELSGNIPACNEPKVSEREG